MAECIEGHGEDTQSRQVDGALCQNVIMNANKIGNGIVLNTNKFMHHPTSCECKKKCSLHRRCPLP
jgi:hypothetical protein